MPLLKSNSRQMKIAQIREKAKTLGVTPGRMKKAELIHSIQAAEGCTMCFGTSDGQCTHTDCCFMADCLKS